MECKCLTCKHIREMEKLIPDEKLRHKVLHITDGLYEAMANENLTQGIVISKLKAQIEILKQYEPRPFKG